MSSRSVVLLTTCHLHLDGVSDLMRLIESVAASLEGGEVAEIRHIVLLQGSAPSESIVLQLQLPDWVDLLSTEARLSSSAARNHMIGHLLSAGDFDPEAIVGFPDDDAWYPLGTLGKIADYFARDGALQLLLARYGPDPSVARAGAAYRPTLQQALSSGACASIFVRARTLAQLGGFHPLLGLGTELSGGEDTEFVHRAFQVAKRHSLIVAGTLVGHEAAEPVKKMKYYEGGLAAIAAHSSASPAARLALVRKLLVGVGWMIAGRMTPHDFVRAVKRARTRVPALRELPLAERYQTLAAGNSGH